MNLVNSKFYHNLDKEDESHIFYLKCNKVGQKTLKFMFSIVIWHRVSGK